MSQLYAPDGWDEPWMYESDDDYDEHSEQEAACDENDLEALMAVQEASLFTRAVMLDENRLQKTESRIDRRRSLTTQQMEAESSFDECRNLTARQTGDGLTQSRSKPEQLLDRLLMAGYSKDDILIMTQEELKGDALDTARDCIIEDAETQLYDKWADNRADNSDDEFAEGNRRLEEDDFDEWAREAEEMALRRKEWEGPKGHILELFEDEFRNLLWRRLPPMTRSEHIVQDYTGIILSRYSDEIARAQEYCEEAGNCIESVELEVENRKDTIEIENREEGIKVGIEIEKETDEPVSYPFFADDEGRIVEHEHLFNVYDQSREELQGLWQDFVEEHDIPSHTQMTQDIFDMFKSFIQTSWTEEFFECEEGDVIEEDDGEDESTSEEEFIRQAVQRPITKKLDRVKNAAKRLDIDEIDELQKYLSELKKEKKLKQKSAGKEKKKSGKKRRRLNDAVGSGGGYGTLSAPLTSIDTGNQFEEIAEPIFYAEPDNQQHPEATLVDSPSEHMDIQEDDTGIIETTDVEMSDDLPDMMDVDHLKAGAIIGKHGSTIRRLELASGAIISVPKVVSNQRRLVLIAGPPCARTLARQLINDELKAWDARRWRYGQPAIVADDDP